jgi:hypothetical protein
MSPTRRFAVIIPSDWSWRIASRATVRETPNRDSSWLRLRTAPSASCPDAIS